MKKVVFLFCLLGAFAFLFLPKLQTKKIKEPGVKEVIKYDNDIVGKIEIAGKTNYLVQGDNNDYYLDHNHKKEEDELGATYVDYRNGLNDKKILVYGHNSKNLEPFFKVLSNYLDENYYHNNPTIKVKLQNTENDYKIFSVMVLPKDEIKHTKITFKGKEYQDHLTWLQDSSIYAINEVVNSEDQIVMLQTCNYSEEDTFLIISAKKVKTI